MDSIINLGNSVSTWVLAALVAVLLVEFGLTIKAWREARLSPYYFQRRQALHQMQSYSIASLVTMMAALAISAYAFSSPVVDATPRTAVLTNAKPTSLNILTEAVVEVAPATANNVAAARFAAPSLPLEYQSLVPQANLNDSTRIGSLQFATDITESYEPVVASAEFAEGEYTMYAVFDYADMADGMTWSWVWRHQGDIVGGGEQMWSYGDAGPGYVYFQPEEGFAAGDYTLELWVNGEFMEKSTIEVSAGIANQ